ncbi:hypothetical protein EYF88_04550 [Paracoccus sediminis]|uniref:Sulfotransferase family protein n=1 Tax=Paracoccus sediminis TaxID=1214787 RepID=A0ABY1YPV3_9RHOB|nr:hypothetical protein [Paracoccus sediminis]TBN52166.1 hypothetical protein EYF88_04550 [Paracoccus sediminis]
MSRKVFQIGFTKCGTTLIARLFQMNGYPAVHWAKGTLAEDIAWSKLTQAAPLWPWADTTACTDMGSLCYLNMAIAEAFMEFAFFARSFPGSAFLLNTRRAEDWVVSRCKHRGVRYARAQARLRRMAAADLAVPAGSIRHSRKGGTAPSFAGQGSAAPGQQPLGRAAGGGWLGNLRTGDLAERLAWARATPSPAAGTPTDPTGWAEKGAAHEIP